MTPRDAWRCPRCSEFTVEYPATSRTDNKTEVCPACGHAEAMEVMAGTLVPQDRWQPALPTNGDCADCGKPVREARAWWHLKRGMVCDPCRKIEVGA